MNKRAIITGITGQDGSYLAELLISKGYKVWGLHRRSSSPMFSHLANVINDFNFRLVEGDVCDSGCITRLIKDVEPDEYYNLAAQSHVGTSFKQPAYTWDVTAGGVLNALEAIRNEKPDTKFYQASSSEMFGCNYTSLFNDKGVEVDRYQDELTPFFPQSPYAIAKLAGHHLVRNYRDSYKIFGCSGILFNHESERRGDQFVTRKITKWLGNFIANDKNPHTPKLKLGNLDACRDWGHAEDYVRAMWLMLQQDKPDDYIIATGESWSCWNFLDEAFGVFGLDYEDYIEIDPELYRPAEVKFLLGRSSRAKNILGWEPQMSFSQLVERMVINDVEEARLSRSRL